MKPRYVPQTGFGRIPHGYVTTTPAPKMEQADMFDAIHECDVIGHKEIATEHDWGTEFRDASGRLIPPWRVTMVWKCVICGAVRGRLP